MADPPDSDSRDVAQRQSARLLSACACLGLMAVRVFLLPSPALWKDPLLVLLGYGMFHSLAGEPRSSRVLIFASALFLAATHVWGQFPHTLAILGFRG